MKIQLTLEIKQSYRPKKKKGSTKPKLEPSVSINNNIKIAEK